MFVHPSRWGTSLPMPSSPTLAQPELRSYATLTGAFGTLLVGGLCAGRRRGIVLPQRIGSRDLALISVATFKLSRMLATDRVSRFARAPFTEERTIGLQDGGGPEVVERPKGEGMRRAVGELVLCPHCLSQWIATAFVGGLVTAPETTRLVASIYVTMSASDALSKGWRAIDARW